MTTGVDVIFDTIAEGARLEVYDTGLHWLPEHGIGWLPFGAEPAPYDKAYWVRYGTYRHTEMERKLLDIRLGLVERFVGNAAVMDIGIGNGSFVTERNKRVGSTLGYDVNPYAMDWLREHEVAGNPYLGPVVNVTLWDVLEHIEEPGALLDNVTGRVFVCMPIYADAEDVHASKHFRPDEHCWYFTESGLERFMAMHGFVLEWSGDPETVAGRDSIGSYVFRRVGDDE
jgi:hypothetical protein